MDDDDELAAAVILRNHTMKLFSVDHDTADAVVARLSNIVDFAGETIADIDS